MSPLGGPTEPGVGLAAKFPLREYALLLLKAALSAALLWWLLRQLDITQLGDLLPRANPVWVGLGVLILTAVPAVSAPRWRAILHHFGFTVLTAALVRALYIGAFFSQILPSSIGGDAWRIWFCHRAGVPVGAAANSVLIERLAGLVVTAFIFFATAHLLLDQIGENSARWAILALLAGCAGVVIVLALAGLWTRIFRNARLLSPFVKFFAAVSACLGSPRLVLIMATTALIGQLMSISAFYAFCRSIDVPISFLDCLVTLGPALLISLAPISFAGWGLREGSLIVILKFYDVSSELALAVSLMFGLSLLIGSLPGALFWISTRGQQRIAGP